MKYDTQAKRPSFVIPPGIYPTQITGAEEKLSKAGNPMLVIEHTVFNPATGLSRDIKDYIVIGGEHSGEWKIGHMCEACGIPKTGEVIPADLIGRSCHVKVKITPAKGDFQESNAITDYLKPDDGTSAVAAPKIIKPAASAQDDSVPF